jgi:hypothetical protein
MQTSSTDSIDTQQQVRSSSSLAESSTITESSSSESAISLRPTSSIPSSESTVIGPIVEQSADDKEISDRTEIEQDDPSEKLHSLPSDKRDVIDSWINNRETNSSEYEIDSSKIRSIGNI